MRGPRPLQEDSHPFAALEQWIDAFVDFHATKHGLAGVRNHEASGGSHDYFLSRLVPVCEKREITAEVTAYELMRGIGNLCLFADDEERYDARKLARLLLAGAR